MKTKIISCSAILIGLLTIACSNESGEQKQEHVFKDYENALEKAKQVQSQIDEAEEKRKKQLEDNMH